MDEQCSGLSDCVPEEIESSVDTTLTVVEDETVVSIGVIVFFGRDKYPFLNKTSCLGVVIRV